ncbi:EAL domain-containing protein, partial [Pontibacterium sp.]|uniref:EAL domain-containing protein n=1 Tax=Pontibacterium sp. TaxID=2036026 RepID=UPI003569518B
PPAERFGLSPKLDRWVIKNVCAFLAESPNKHLNLSINLSGLSIADDELLFCVRNLLEEYKVDPQQMCFEITETAAISNLANAVRFINAMKEIGCRFALDDFGSGLSSFGYLKTLPVDFVKIDGIFVKDILDDEVDMAMVRSINDIGHLMGKKTIAEFVENSEIADRLREVGVDYAQGYGIAKPHSIELLTDLSLTPQTTVPEADSEVCI